MGTGPSPSENSEEEYDDYTVEVGQSTFDEHDDERDDSGGGIAGGIATVAAGKGGETAGTVGGGGTIVTTGNEPGQQNPDGECEEPTDDDSESDEESVEIEARIIVQTDPWDVVGWGLEPRLKRLQEEFANVDVRYALLEPRTVHRGEWANAVGEYEMPLTQDPDLPDNTALSYTALKEAQRQGMFREYLRRLRIAALVEGANIEDIDLLMALADKIGLDLTGIDWHSAEGEEILEYRELPIFHPSIGVRQETWSGDIEYHFIESALRGEAIQPHLINRPLGTFVAKYQPATRAEILAVYDSVQSEDIKPVYIGGCEFFIRK